jgi:hypothetical protein
VHAEIDNVQIVLKDLVLTKPLMVLLYANKIANHLVLFVKVLNAVFAVLVLN